jgi:Domain of unknown function (DUF4253)
MTPTKVNKGPKLERRSLLKGAIAVALSGGAGGSALAGANPEGAMNSKDYAQIRAEAEARLIASFPYERIEIDGGEALAVRDDLKAHHRGWPVVVGGDNELALIAESIEYGSQRSPHEILRIAQRLKHPDDLVAHIARGTAAANEFTRQLLEKGGPFPNMIDVGPDGVARELSTQDVRERIKDSLASSEPAEGEWPSNPPSSGGLTVAKDMRGRPLEKVHIVLLPTQEPAAVPAFLQWGGWNSCPPPEYHVAALRSWQVGYGTELVGLSHDVMNLRVTRRPASRAAAMELAREHFLYCNDIVWQGTGAYAPLAAQLLNDDWWYFWWD